VPESFSSSPVPSEFQSIRVVAFDVVGTLLEPVPGVGEIYHLIGQEFGCRRTLQEVTSRFREAFAATESRPELLQQKGLDPWWTSEAEEFRRWRQIVGLVLDDVSDLERCFQKIHDHFAKPSAWKIFPDVQPVIARLKQLGRTVVMASNFDNRLHHVWKGTSELSQVDDCFISSELGARKPSVGFFRMMCERLQVHPEEILMVGDDWENDVVAPRQIGLHAVWLNRKATTGSQDFADRDSIHTLGQILPSL